jgi:hypothetical protein
MSDQGQNRWILLINKTPRGPLTELEVKTLLRDGHVRINDIAFKLSPENPKLQSEWKFLWQFAEFDRRRHDRQGAAAPPKQLEVPVKESERRKSRTPGEIESQLRSHLSGALSHLTLRDLITTQKGRRPVTTEPVEAETAPVAEETPAEAAPSRGPWRLVAGIAIALGMMGLLMRSLSRINASREAELENRRSGEVSALNPVKPDARAPAARNSSDATRPQKPPSIRLGGAHSPAPAEPRGLPEARPAERQPDDEPRRTADDIDRLSEESRDGEEEIRPEMDNPEEIAPEPARKRRSPKREPGGEVPSGEGENPDR